MIYPVDSIIDLFILSEVEFQGNLFLGLLGQQIYIKISIIT